MVLRKCTYTGIQYGYKHLSCKKHVHLVILPGQQIDNYYVQYGLSALYVLLLFY
jgi:hypothetical protein